MNIRYPIYEGVYRILTNHPRAAPVFSSENLACGGGTHPGP